MRKAKLWPKIVFTIGVVGVGSAFGLWYATRHQPMPPDLERSVRRVAELDPKLQSMLDKALADGVLTFVEGNAIVEAAERLRNESP